jgi:hypothetical protein
MRNTGPVIAMALASETVDAPVATVRGRWPGVAPKSGMMRAVSCVGLKTVILLTATLAPMSTIVCPCAKLV